MRDYNLIIDAKDTSSTVTFNFDTDGCTHLCVRNFKPDAKGNEFYSISVTVKVDDVRAMIAFMEVFLHEHELQKEKEKLGA